jgi:hypothetical protein
LLDKIPLTLKSVVERLGLVFSGSTAVDEPDYSGDCLSANRNSESNEKPRCASDDETELRQVVSDRTNPLLETSRDAKEVIDGERGLLETEAKSVNAASGNVAGPVEVAEYSPLRAASGGRQGRRQLAPQCGQFGATAFGIDCPGVEQSLGNLSEILQSLQSWPASLGRKPGKPLLHKLDLTTSRTQRLLIHSEAESRDAFSAELAEKLLAEARACVERDCNGGDLTLEVARLLCRERHALSCQKPEAIRQVIDAGAEQRPDIGQFLKTTTNDIDLTAEVCDDVVAEAVWIEVRSIWRRRFDDWWEERRRGLHATAAVGDCLLRCGPLFSLCCDVSDSLLNRAARRVSCAD